VQKLSVKINNRLLLSLLLSAQKDPNKRARGGHFYWRLNSGEKYDCNNRIFLLYLVADPIKLFSCLPFLLTVKLACLSHVEKMH